MRACSHRGDRAPQISKELIGHLRRLDLGEEHPRRLLAQQDRCLGGAADSGGDDLGNRCATLLGEQHDEPDLVDPMLSMERTGPPRTSVPDRMPGRSEQLSVASITTQHQAVQFGIVGRDRCRSAARPSPGRPPAGRSWHRCRSRAVWPARFIQARRALRDPIARAAQGRGAPSDDEPGENIERQSGRDEHCADHCDEQEAMDHPSCRSDDEMSDSEQNGRRDRQTAEREAAHLGDIDRRPCAVVEPDVEHGHDDERDRCGFEDREDEADLCRTCRRDDRKNNDDGRAEGIEQLEHRSQPPWERCRKGPEGVVDRCAVSRAIPGRRARREAPLTTMRTTSGACRRYSSSGTKRCAQANGVGRSCSRTGARPAPRVILDS